MRFKVILIGRNNALIDDFFSQMDMELDLLTSSQRYEDLLRHLELIKPAGLVYCLGREATDDMNKLNSLKRRLERAKVSLIAIGEKKDIDELEGIAPGACALTIPKPFTPDEVQRKIVSYLAGVGMNEKDMDNLRDKYYQQEMDKLRSSGGGSQKSLMDELAELENELSMETDLHLDNPPQASGSSGSREGAFSPRPVSSHASQAGAAASPPLSELLNPAEHSASGAEEAPRGPKKHILIIDDDPLMLKIIKDHLHNLYDVGSAISGKVAYRFLEKRHTDLILLDYVMPEENGPAVLKHLRANDSTKDIPVVFLTGMQERGKIQEALSLKPQGYLLKPVDKKQLMGMVKSLIG